MSEFNFKSQICTSLVQSERLLALGLKKETADMTIVGKYIGCDDDGAMVFEDTPSVYPPMLRKDIPAWSLHRLIEMMGDMFEGQHWLGFNIEKNYDDMIDCIEWLIKKGYFNKEYLA